jgi:hypothetical protein
VGSVFYCGLHCAVHSKTLIPFSIYYITSFEFLSYPGSRLMDQSTSYFANIKTILFWILILAMLCFAELIFETVQNEIQFNSGSRWMMMNHHHQVDPHTDRS